MFFESWPALAKVFLTAVLGYSFLILFLRISGKRTLSQMNAFDFIVTVAFGSTLATAILSKQTTLSEGLMALGTLILLQYTVAWASIRSKWFKRATKSEPTLLFYRNEFIDSALKKERIARQEVYQAMRAQGISSTKQVEAVVLETNGQLSITKKSTDNSALKDIRNFPE